MADVKINQSKFTLGDSGLKISNDDIATPNEYVSIVHDEDDALTTVGSGNRVTNHESPIYLNDGTNGIGIYYYDFPADSAGYGFVLVGDAEEYARFHWARDNTVTLINNSANVSGTEVGGDFCIFDNTTNVRISNLLGAPVRILLDVHYTESLVAP